MISLRTWTLSLVVCAVSAISSAQGVHDQPTTLKLGTKLRVLDVTVVDDHGNPSTEDLRERDFRVFDDRKERKIESLERNDVVGSTTTPPRTIIVVDHLNSTWSQERWEQEKVKEFFTGQPEQLPHETELVLLTAQGAQTAQSFTREKTALLKATDQLEPRVPDRLQGSWAAENFSMAMTALEEVGLQVKGFGGRKNVLYVGTGGPGISLIGQDAQTQDKINAYVRHAIDSIVDARLTLFVITPEIQVGDVRFPYGQSPSGYLDDGGDSGLNSNSVAGVDLVASTATGADPFTGAINLGLIARTTGGKLYTNRNDIAMEMEEAVALGSKFYTLSYKPDPDERDGTFVPIAIKLRRPGLHALTKQGYYAQGRGVVADSDLQGQYDLRRAGQAGISFQDIKLTARVLSRREVGEVVEFGVAVRPSDLSFQPTPDGHYAGRISLAALSVDGQREMLASEAKLVGVTSPTLAGSKSGNSKDLPVTISVRVPRRTDHVRIVIRDAMTGRLGAVDLDRKTVEGRSAQKAN